MHETSKKQLIRYGSISAVILALIGILYGLFYVNTFVRRKYFTTAAEKVLRASDMHTRDIHITGLIQPRYPHLISAAVLSAKIDGDNGFIVFLPLTGKYGVYTGVFLYEKTGSCRFCGLAGTVYQSSDAAYYGITTGTIKMQQKKIADLLEHYEK